MGVPNLVFAGAAQELERDATDLMDRLTDGRYRLEMRTEKVNKGDGETVETLEIVVVADSGKERPFARLSGGEKFRVTLVLHTSLTRSSFGGRERQSNSWALMKGGVRSIPRESLPCWTHCVCCTTNSRSS